MSTDLQSNEADLGVFIERVGSSFSTAQESLGTGLDIPINFMIANAELEVKAALNLNAEGRTVIQTISAENIREGGIDPNILSTVRIGFSVAAHDLLQVSTPSDRPSRKPEDVVGEIRNRPNIAQLEKILGTLNINVTYIPDRKRWLAEVRDPKDRLVREIVLPDDFKEDDVD